MDAVIELEVGGKTEAMPLDMFVRWACLIDAVDVISEKCEQLGLDKDDDSWIKPNAIEKFINDRFPSMKHNIISDLKRPGLANIRP